MIIAKEKSPFFFFSQSKNAGRESWFKIWWIRKVWQITFESRLEGGEEIIHGPVIEIEFPPWEEHVGAENLQGPGRPLWLEWGWKWRMWDQGGVRASSWETLACCNWEGFSFILKELANHWRDLYREVTCFDLCGFCVENRFGRAKVKTGRPMRRLVQ